MLGHSSPVAMTSVASSARLGEVEVTWPGDKGAASGTLEAEEELTSGLRPRSLAVEAVLSLDWPLFAF